MTVAVEVGVSVAVGVLYVLMWMALQGLMNQIPTSSNTPSIAPSNGAGGTIERETRGRKLLPSSKDVPHIRQVLAPSATLALQTGQRLASLLTSTLKPHAGHRPRPPLKVAPQFGHFILSFSQIDFCVSSNVIITELLTLSNMNLIDKRGKPMYTVMMTLKAWR